MEIKDVENHNHGWLVKTNIVHDKVVTLQIEDEVENIIYEMGKRFVDILKGLEMMWWLVA